MHTTAISKSNYLPYLEREATERAYWQGNAARKLGIDGELVTAQNFRYLSDGIDPVYGEVLRTRERHSLSRNGKEYAWPVRLYDATIIAPRTASVLSVVDDRISVAHREAVDDILPVIDRLAATANKSGPRLSLTENAVYAAYHHQTSRELDPMQHTHVAIINLTYSEEKASWGALAAYKLYQAGTPIQGVYRERFLERLWDFGYTISEDRREIEGVSPALVEKLSIRDQKIEAVRVDFFEKYGEWPTSGEMNILVRNHRPEKVYLPKEEIRERQLARLPPTERIELTGLREQAREQERIRPHRSLRHHVAPEPGMQVRPFSYGDASG